MNGVELQLLIKECIREVLIESPTFKTLKKNKVPLTDEERKQVMNAGAVWHHGPKGEPSPAVQKAVINGKIWYWCATHRYGEIKKNLESAIKSFDRVKETA